QTAGYASCWFDLKYRDGLTLALHDNVTERMDIITSFQPGSCRLADDDPRSVVLVQRLQAGAEIDGIADHGVAHDRLRADVAGDHVAGVDADADIEPGLALARPLLVHLVQRPDHRERRPHRVVCTVLR